MEDGLPLLIQNTHQGVITECKRGNIFFFPFFFLFRVQVGRYLKKLSILSAKKWRYFKTTTVAAKRTTGKCRRKHCLCNTEEKHLGQTFNMWVAGSLCSAVTLFLSWVLMSAGFGDNPFYFQQKHHPKSSHLFLKRPIKLGKRLVWRETPLGNNLCRFPKTVRSVASCMQNTQ